MRFLIESETICAGQIKELTVCFAHPIPAHSMWSPLPDKPLISVILPVFNRAALVNETIQSLLHQTYPHLEILAVVDGGSSDNSGEIVTALAAQDARIRPLFTEPLNQMQARNRAIAAARGELIAHMDDDDVALPTRFENQLAWMRTHELGVCGGQTKWFGDAETILWFPENHETIRVELLFRIAILLPTVLLRTEIANLFPLDEELETFADYQQLTQLVTHCRLGNVSNIVLKERAHSDQLHKRRHDAMKADGRKIRLGYFDALFPNASAAERVRFQRTVQHIPCDNTGELQEIGAWYAELAQLPEPFFQQMMAIRWGSTCRVSAVLGLDAYQVYQTILPKIHAAADPNNPELRLACEQRLPASAPVQVADAPVYAAEGKP